MKTIAFAALAVLDLVLGTLNFAAPAHAATYYYGMTQSNNGNGDGGGGDTTRIVNAERPAPCRPFSFPLKSFSSTQAPGCLGLLLSQRAR